MSDTTTPETAPRQRIQRRPRLVHRHPDPHVRFMSKWVEDEVTGCWIWQGSLNDAGYGRFAHDGRSNLAHRYSYQYFNGEIPDNAFVCHSCDTPACCNPTHLWLGSQADNMRDASQKGRLPTGSRRYRGTPEHVVKLIRRLHEQGLRQKDVAARAGVCVGTVYRITSGHRHRETY